MKKNFTRIIGVSLSLVILVATMLFSFSGCAGWNNDVAKQGSVFGSTSADYIVINYAGNKIFDVYKLKNQYVQSERDSDGCNFIDNNGNPIIISGDTKIIRINDSSTWNEYTEYHYEKDGGEYFDFAKNKDKSK